MTLHFEHNSLFFCPVFALNSSKAFPFYVIFKIDEKLFFIKIFNCSKSKTKINYYFIVKFLIYSIKNSSLIIIFFFKFKRIFIFPYLTCIILGPSNNGISLIIKQATKYFLLMTLRRVRKEKALILPLKTYKHSPLFASHIRHVQSTPAVIIFVP